jgi:hypothetical protein
VVGLFLPLSFSPTGCFLSLVSANRWFDAREFQMFFAARPTPRSGGFLLLRAKAFTLLISSRKKQTARWQAGLWHIYFYNVYLNIKTIDTFSIGGRESPAGGYRRD